MARTNPSTQRARNPRITDDGNRRRNRKIARARKRYTDAINRAKQAGKVGIR